MAAITGEIIDPVRNDDARGPTREVVIKCLGGLVSSNTSRAVELAQVFLGLRVDGKHRISGVEVLRFQLGNAEELGVPVGMLTSFQSLLDLPQSQSRVLQPVPDDGGAHGSPQVRHRIGDLPGR